MTLTVYVKIKDIGGDALFLYIYPERFNSPLNSNEISSPNERAINQYGMHIKFLREISLFFLI